MITIQEKHFNLRAIMNSGQIFRMYERSEGEFEVFSGSRRLKATQKSGDSFANDAPVTLDCTQDEFDSYWRRYFDLDTDYDAIIKLAMNSGNRFMSESARLFGDIRVLHQDLFEMLITFIISQQKQIPSIRKCVEALSERFGEKMGDYYAFPTAEAIVAGGPDGLKGLSLGYRERYIYESSLMYINSQKLPDEDVSYEEAKALLKSFCGVGEKVANCICLFGIHMVSAFPVDTHVKDILYREFYDGDQPQEKLRDKDYFQLLDDKFADFKDVQGILQQWMFAYEISGMKEDA